MRLETWELLGPSSNTPIEFMSGLLDTASDFLTPVTKMTLGASERGDAGDTAPVDPKATGVTFEEIGDATGVGDVIPTQPEDARVDPFAGDPLVAQEEAAAKARAKAETQAIMDEAEEISLQERELQLAQDRARLQAKARSIRNQQNLTALDHICAELLDVGLYTKPTDPFTQMLHKEGIKDVRMLMDYTLDDFSAAGYPLPRALASQFQALTHWWKHGEDRSRYGDNYFLRAIAMDNDDFYDYCRTMKELDEFVRSSSPPSSVVVPLREEVPAVVPVAGVDSNRAKLENARRKSMMQSLSGTPQSKPNVTGRTQARASRGSSGMPPSQTPQPPPGNSNLPPRTPGSGMGSGPPGGPPPNQPTFFTSPGGNGGGGDPIQVHMVYPSSSAASEFDKAGRRSNSDYDKFSSKEQWHKWQRSTLGTAFEHRCEDVLKPTFTPDPNNPDAVRLFASQQRFMYSVFSRVLVEGKAADILRDYSDPSKPNFGDAQAIYSDLCDHFDTGAQARLNASHWETQLNSLRLNKSWTKSVRAFTIKVTYTIKNHKEATKGVHDDAYYLEKLNNCFTEHRDMSAYIQNMETSRSMIVRSLGDTAEPITYAQQAHELEQYAMVLDDRYAKANARKREAHSTNTDKQNGGGTGGGDGKKGRGKGKGRGTGGRGTGGRDGDNQDNRSGGRGRGGGNRNNQNRGALRFISDETWNSMTRDQRAEIIRQREQARVANALQQQPGTDASTSSSTPVIEVNNQQQQQQQQQQSQQTPSQPGSMLRGMLSQASQRSANASQQGTDEFTINGTTYRRVNVTYHTSHAHANTIDGALIDGGANGSVRGEDAIMVDFVEGATVNLTGLANSAVDGLKLGTAAAVGRTVNDGDVLLLFPQTADLGRGKTILSKGQLEKFGSIVDDTSRAAGGRQCMITHEGYVIPIHTRDGLPRIDMRKPTEAELSSLPAVWLTSDETWDPEVLDCEFNVEEDAGFYDAVMQDPEVQRRIEERDPRVNEYGFLRTRDDYEVLFRAQDEFIAANQHLDPDDDVFYDAYSTGVNLIDPTGESLPHAHDVPTESTLDRAINRMLSVFPNKLRRHFPHLDALKPYFGWASNEKIKQMLDKTTQHYRGVVHHPFRKHFKSQFPAANVRRRNEWVATDTFFCDTPAADDGVPGHAGATMMQVYVGMQTGHVLGYPMTSEKQIPETLEDAIRTTGAPVGLMSDNAKAQLHGRAKDLLRMYCIDDRQSEPHYQHQNPAERKIQEVKKTMNSVMDRTGCPSRWWLLAAIYSLALLRILPNANGEIPNNLVSGQIDDVSRFMHFHFWQDVFVESHRRGQKEELARWCFPADNVGDELTYMVLLNETEELVPRSNVRPARDPLYPNLRLRPQTDDLRLPKVETVTEPDDPPAAQMTGPSGEPKRQSTDKPTIFNLQDNFDVPVHLPQFSPEELIGLTYLHDIGDGQLVRASIVKKIHDRDAEDHQRIKMLVSYDDGKVEELVSYNELCDLVAEQHEREEAGEQEVFAFREILEHQGPLKPTDPRYKGSAYNVLVLWEDQTKTWEPLSLMIASDPATLASYALEHGLLEISGWKKLKRIGRRAKVLKRMLNMSRKGQKFNAVIHKFGVRVPRDAKEARRLDELNGNTYWQDAMDTELAQLLEYQVFHSLGKDARVPDGYQNIPVRFVFDVKQDLRRKARLVARGDKTAPPADSVYSGVASLRSLRIVCFLAELNGLEVTGGDIGNAYLEAYTKEKVCFRAGPEFGALAGHLLMIDKALYGLRTSGARFHAKLADTLRALGFKPTYADPDVWIRDAGNCSEYVVVYVDDIFTALKNPSKFYDSLRGDPWFYKLKNVEEPKYHLGGDFFRDKDGTYCYGAQTYVKRLVENYKTMFGELPKEYHAPMEKDDKPELDESPLEGPAGIQQFQSLIGAVQWTISLCRFDVLHAVMSLGRFRAAPRKGHLERLKRLVGYMRKRPHGAIRFRTEIPNHEATFGANPIRYDWMETVYGRPQEEIDPRAPEPKGKPIRTTSFCDANLMHDMVTGRSASGILEFLNQTPIDWFSKRQNQVETATYGSEFMVARQATERIIDLRYTLRSFGVPLDGPAWLFGDNQSVVTSSTIPHSTLSKRWNALSYHRVREAVAGGWLRFEHIPGTENPADIFTKPLPWHTMRAFVEPLLMWKGETDVASGAQSPEGSDKDPGCDTPGGAPVKPEAAVLYADRGARTSRADLEIDYGIDQYGTMHHTVYSPNDTMDYSVPAGSACTSMYSTRALSGRSESSPTI